jgi:hypothetical protein
MHHIWAEFESGVFSRAVIQINTKFENFAGLYFSAFYNISQAKFCNFTNFNMLFPAVVMEFIILARIKI